MTPSWMSGYVGDVSYTLGFYRELSPTYLSLACVLNDVDGPNPTRDLRYCELGCGRGYGTALLAAANPNVEFVGIDFNPSHIAEARNLCSRAGLSNVTFYEMSFGEAARSSDSRLKDFDIVSLHGVYSWVTAEVRNEIHHFLRDKVLAGGLVYNSYNTLPGWATMGPVHHLVMQTAQRSSRDSVAVIGKALETLTALVQNKGAFATQNPSLKARLEQMAKQDATYLAHEFVNKGWQPHYVTQVMENFSEAKLTYVGSANLLENRLDLSVPKDLQTMIKAAPDTAMRELLKDYAVNKQFRRDLYIKGPQQLSTSQKHRRFNETPFVRMLAGKEGPTKFHLPIGEATPKKQSLDNIMDALGDRVLTGGELLESCQKAGTADAEAVILMLMLINAGSIAPARSDHGTIDHGPSHRLNQVVMEATLGGDTHRFLATPIVGSALGTTLIDRVMAAEIVRLERATDDEIANAVFDRLETAGQSFQRDRQALTRDNSKSEIVRLVKNFRDTKLPRWNALGIVSRPSAI